MIIHDFYVIGITIDPFEAYPPLIVDPDAVLPCPVAAKLLQPVGWRDAEIVQCDGIVKHAALAFQAALPIADLLDVFETLIKEEDTSVTLSFEPTIPFR